MGTRAGKSGRKRKAATQGVLPFRRIGGARPRAGRKPKGEQAGVPHVTRKVLAPRFPVHATIKLVRGLPSLRQRREYAALREAFAAGCDRFAFRLVHYAVLNEHLHMVVEAADREALTRGMQGLLIRIAKALNRLWSRRGRVFADRFHDRILKSPREVRTALAYVFGNAHKHAAQGHALAGANKPIDTFTSAPWFDGWKDPLTVRGLEAITRPIAHAHTWLLTQGWRRHGLLPFHEPPTRNAS